MQANLFETPTPTKIIALRDYQVEAKRKVYAQVREGKNRILVCAPCGWGKTYFTASIIKDALSKGKKALFVVPYRTLIGQAAEAFDDMGIDYGVIAGSYRENYWAPAQIATIQTLAGDRSIDWFQYDILVLDESHILGFAEWVKQHFPLLKNFEEVLSAQSFISEMETLGFHTDFHIPTWEEVKAKYQSIKLEATAEQKTAYEVIRKYKAVFQQAKTPNQKIIIGLTGSPVRLSKKEFMSDLFSSQVKAETPKEMIEKGMLVGCDYFRVDGADLTGVHTSMGEYVQNEISERCSDPEVVKWAVSNYKEICPTRTFICFAVDVRHAEMLVNEFQKEGVDAHLVTAQTSDRERERLFSALGSGQIRGLVSVGCLSVGFDVPSISCVISCRPTLSQALWIQQVGRGMRLSPGKEDCFVLDQAGNLKRFGRIEDYEYPDLESKEFVVDVAPVKECPECNRMLPVFAQQCPCGHEFEAGMGAEKVRPTGKMELYIAEDDKPMYESYRSMLRSAFSKGYSPDWAVMQTQQRFGRFPKRQWAKGAVFGPEPSQLNKMFYEKYLDNVIKKKQEDPNVEEKIKKRYNDKWKDKHFYNEFGVTPCP